MISTRLTKQLGIRHPVVQAALGGVACADLVAAVSNAGGLGILGMNRRSPDFIRNQIGRTRELTRAPFGVGITPAPAHAAPDGLVAGDGSAIMPGRHWKEGRPVLQESGA
jgi:enoyl-[acyl-carrier protein] reductase II